MNPDQAFEQARDHYNQGNALRDGGRIDEAIASYKLAINYKPDLSEAFNNLGNALAMLGRFEEAAAAFRKVIELRPNNAVAFNNLGAALDKLGRRAESLAAIEKAIAIDGSYLNAQTNRASVLRAMGRLDDSIRQCDQIILRVPNSAPANLIRATCLLIMSRQNEAIAAFRRTIAIRPQSAEAWNGLGESMRQTGNLAESIHALRRATELNPNYADAHLNLGIALGEHDKLQEAIDTLKRAAELDPQNPFAHCNLGIAHSFVLQFDLAETSYRRAIELRPDYAVAHHALALAQLVQERFEEGWQGYEYRWKLPTAPKPYGFTAPKWLGEDLRGKTILLHTEQGLGDSLQFVRYVPLIARQAARVYLYCQPPLIRLFSQLKDATLLIDPNQKIPQHDYHCPLMSLPLAFGARLENIPAEVPYLHAEEGLLEIWKPKLDWSKKLRIGIVWSGNPKHKSDRQRSIPLHALAPLSKFIDQVAFYGLQVGDALSQIAGVSELKLTDFSADLQDFTDTAAVIQQLDLVISVDTATAHLAGALGRPVWILLAHVPDWRWLLERSDSPWYPTARIFRQTRPGDWSSVVESVIQEIARLLTARLNG